MSKNRVALNDDEMDIVSGGQLLWDDKVSTVCIVPTIKNPVTTVYSFEGYTYDEVKKYVGTHTKDYSDEGILNCLLNADPPMLKKVL